MPLAIFRADASAIMGGGHVMRCLSVASALSAMGWQCRFHTMAESVRVVPALAGYELRPADEIPDRADLAIFDHYGLSRAYEESWRPFVDRILVIDDLADRPHDCDVLLDQGAGRLVQDYSGLVSPRAAVLVGPSYALLRPRFHHLRQDALARRDGRPIERVLVSFGANDARNMIVPTLEGLNRVLPGADIDVVISASAPNFAKIVAASSPRTRILPDVDDMAALMVQADLSVGAAGIMSWERCCLGLPSVAVVIANNQRGNGAALTAMGAASVVYKDESIEAAMAALSQDPTARMAMAQRAALLCDGTGTARLMLALVPERTKDGAPLSLRPANADDGEAIFRWQTFPGARKHFRDPSLPTRDGHFAWLDRMLVDPRRHLEIVEVDGEPAGILRLDPHEDHRWEVSILISGEKHGQGIGPAALRALRRLVPDDELVAEVKSDNVPSLRAFAAAGFVSKSSTLSDVTLVSPRR